MNHQEASGAVGSDRTYIAYGQHIGSDLEYARGKVLAYQEAPTVLIETPDGRRVWWAAHLTQEAQQ
ncbi:hypothetical protein SEA_LITNINMCQUEEN_104 [Gordonia phage LitninMcQueen]